MLNRLLRFFRPEPWDDPPPCRCKHPRYEHQMETPDGACAWLPCGCRRYRP